MSRLGLSALVFLLAARVVNAQDAAPLAAPVKAALDGVQTNLNIVWVVTAAALVFFMQAGFAALETGAVRAKNSINVSMKNFADFLVTMLCWYAVGHAVMFGHTWNGWVGISGFGLEGMHSPWGYAFFIFQVVFAGTSATIVSGAAAERMQFGGYLLLSAAIGLVIYPVFGHWAWGGAYYADHKGWLAQMGFVDFAGSTVVHSMGGWIALVVAWFLGPRLGRYDANGKLQPIAGHDLPFATLGVFILWLGWFGFNGGSTLVGDGSLAKVVVNTNLAAAAGGLAALIISRMTDRQTDVGKILNGTLAGLVAITAGCNAANPLGAVIMGIGAGVVTLAFQWVMDHVLKIDDPVGAVAVHLGSGVWGTLALAVLSPVENLPAGGHLAQLGIQAVGVAACAVWAVVTTVILCFILKITGHLRVSKDEELSGLNLSEHDAKLPWTDTISTINAIVQDGDLSRRVEVDYNTEASIVAERFNTLLSELEKKHFAEEQLRRELETKVLERTRSIGDLLNTTGQGFLSFTKDYKVQPEYSKACEQIFGKPITGLDITQLMFGRNTDKNTPTQVRSLMDLIFNGTNPEMIVTLLPKEIKLNGRIVQVEYSAAFQSQQGLEDKVMVVLTDVTQKLEMEAKLKTDAQWNNIVVKIALDKEGFLQFLRETRRLRNLITDQLSRPAALIDLVETYRHLHSLKGGAAMYGLENVAEKAHAIETRIESLRSRRGDLSAAAISELKGNVAEMQDLLNTWLEQINAVLPEEERSAGERLYQIPVSKFEEFRRYLTQNLPGDAGARTLHAFDRLYRQPIGKVFRKYALAARELARRMDKVVDIEVNGGDIEVPLEKLEPLFSNLVHLVRNSVDHGLEVPEQRRRLGKPEAGLLTLGAARNGDGIMLTVADDGGGLNLAQIRQAAIRKGLLPAETPEDISPKELLRFIFMPGFSTKATPTLTSGRGVGLDAVKAALDALGGQLQVTTRPHRGTTIKMLIPAV